MERGRGGGIALAVEKDPALLHPLKGVKDLPEGLGKADEEVAAFLQAAVEVGHEAARSLDTEIDGHVAAEDDIHAVHKRGQRFGDQVDLLETDHLPHLRLQDVDFAPALKVAGEVGRFDPLDLAFGETALASILQGLAAQVGGQNLHRPAGGEA
jgi:hypothetical protein